MATVTGLTAERMQEIIDATITDADIVAGHLILTLHDGSTIDAGPVTPGKGSAFPAGATDGDIWVRTDQPGDPLYEMKDGVWTLLGAGGGGLNKVTSFPASPADGDVVVRTDLNGSPMFAYSTENGWEQTPRMGAVTVSSTRVTHNVAQAIANQTTTALAFNTEDHDTDTMHDPATNNTRITIKTPGLYHIQTRLEWASGSGSVFQTSIYLNGSTLIGNAERSAQGGVGENTVQELNVIRRLVAGDYLEVKVWHNNGGSLNMQSIGERSPYFAASWLGGAGQTVDERGVPTVRGTRAAAQGLPPGATTAIQLTAVDYDTDSMWSNVASTRFTAKTPGIYKISGQLWWAPDATSARQLLIKKNGVQVAIVQDDPLTSSGAAMGQEINTEVQLAAGDYVEFCGWHSAGGGATTLNVTGSLFTASLVATGKTVTPFVRAYKTASTQTVPDGGTDTAVSFDAEESDNDNIHDTVTNNTRFTCRTAGVYAIHANVTFASNASGARWLQIRKNGSTHIEQRIINGTGDSRDTAAEVSCIAELAVGDYLEVVATVTGAGAALALTGGQNGRGNKFEMVKIGAPITGQTGIEVVESTQAPAFQNAWQNQAGEQAAGFYKDRGRVYFRGVVEAGTSAVIFTLPVGYRPPASVRLPVTAFVGGGYTTQHVRIGTDGTVNYIPGAVGAGNWVQLDNLDFRL